ncbi:hypothetical protein Areg01_63190 [Actinoplanes regularis]|nr:hypothetical protein Areg01_63190 [Actinoplanes regularis]
MTDQLEELFAGMRAEVIREIKPPGTDAAHRTVRRRRTTGAVSAAVAALVAIGVVVGLTGLPRTSTLPADPATLAETARRALHESTGGTALFEAAAPVTADYSAAQTAYYGAITLHLACAGTGKITLLVEAREHDAAPYREIARVDANCSADPKPTSTTFGFDWESDQVVLRLADPGRAAGQAGFAYRATSDTGKPYPARPLYSGVPNPDSSLISPEILKSLMHRGGQGVFGNHKTIGGNVKPTSILSRGGMPDGEYRLLLVCLGSGTVTFELHHKEKLLFRTEMRCGSPAVRQEFPIGRIADANAQGKLSDVHLGHRSDSPGLALVSWAMFDVA